MKHVNRGLLAALLALSFVACEEEEPPFVSPVTWDTAQVVVKGAADSKRLLVEISDTEARRSYGLMARPSLDPESGMLFTYDSEQAGTAAFWMFRTKIPLDIAFIDSAGAIGKILNMVPCESELYADACPRYEPNVPYRSALEVNQGWFARHGIVEGDTVRLETRSGG